MEIVTERVAVTTTGSAGSASGNASSAVCHGLLLDVYLEFHASAPNTTDVTITHENPTRGNLLAVSNVNTSALFAPRVKPVDNANVAITNAHDKFPLMGNVKISVAQCNALTDAVVAHVRYLKP